MSYLFSFIYNEEIDLIPIEVKNNPTSYRCSCGNSFNGILFNEKTGELSGTPTKVFSLICSISAINTYGNSNEVKLTLNSIKPQCNNDNGWKTTNVGFSSVKACDSTIYGNMYRKCIASNSTKSGIWNENIDRTQCSNNTFNKDNYNEYVEIGMKFNNLTDNLNENDIIIIQNVISIILKEDISHIYIQIIYRRRSRLLLENEEDNIKIVIITDEVSRINTLINNKETQNEILEEIKESSQSNTFQISTIEFVITCKSDDDDEKNVGAIVGGVIGGVVILGIIIGLLILFWRSGNVKRSTSISLSKNERLRLSTADEIDIEKNGKNIKI